MGNLRSFIGVLCFIATFHYSVCSYEIPAVPQPQVQDYPVNDTCLDCICQAISNCDKKYYCKADVCGMFRMTVPYWIDGNNLPVDSGDDPKNIEDYRNCANNEKCARQTASNYLTRYARDCDGNGVIDCFDYAGMHKWGPFGGCQKNPIADSGSYYGVLKTCLSCEKNTETHCTNGTS